MYLVGKIRDALIPQRMNYDTANRKQNFSGSGEPILIPVKEDLVGKLELNVPFTQIVH